MRRVLYLLVMVMVLLLATTGNQVQAEYNGPIPGGGLVTGGGEEDPGDDGGDGGHPWGGEQSPTEVDGKDRPSLVMGTGFTVVDVAINYLFTREIKTYHYRSSYHPRSAACCGRYDEPVYNRNQKYVGRDR